RVHLVVTETLDAGAIGEHILHTVKHALENLVLPCQPQETGQDHCQDQTLAMDQEPSKIKSKHNPSEAKPETANSQNCVSEIISEPEQNNITKTNNEKETSNDPIQTQFNKSRNIMSSQPLTNKSMSSQLPPEGLIIPSRLTIFAQVIECEYLRSKYKFRMNSERTPHCRQSANQNSQQKTHCRQSTNQNSEDKPHCRQSANQNSEETPLETQNLKEDPFVEHSNDDFNKTRKNNISCEDESVDIPIEFTSRCQIEQQNPNRSESNTCPDYWKHERSSINCERCKENRNRGTSTNPSCDNSEMFSERSRGCRETPDELFTDRERRSKSPKRISTSCNQSQTQEDLHTHCDSNTIQFSNKSQNQAIQTSVKDLSRTDCTRESIPGKIELVLNAKKQLGGHYDSEHLAHIPHKVLSQPVQVLCVDLNSLQDVNRVLDGVQESFSLNHVASGQADAIVSWFEIDLYKNIRLSSCIQENSHWDQAVFPVFNDIVFDTGNNGYTHCSLNNEQTIVEHSNSNVDKELDASPHGREMEDSIHRELAGNISNADEYDSDNQWDHLDIANIKKDPKTNNKHEKVNVKNDLTIGGSKERAFKTQQPTKETNITLTMTCKDGLINLELFNNETTFVTLKTSETKCDKSGNSGGINATENTLHRSSGENITSKSTLGISDINISENTLETLKISNVAINFNLINPNNVSNMTQTEHEVPNKALLELNVPSDLIQGCQLIHHHVDNIVDNIKERMSSVRNVLDLTRFPLLGIQCLKTFPMCKLFYLLNETIDSMLTSYLTSLDIDPVRYYCLNKSDVNSDLGSHVKFDVVLVDILDTRGDFVGLQYLSSVMSCLSTTCLLLPERVNIYCQLTDCPWLNKQSHMLAEEDRFEISPFINQYQVPQHPDIDIGSLSHTPLSVPSLLSSLPLPNLFSAISTQSLLSPSSSGCVNGLFYWMRLELSPGVEVTRSRGVFRVSPGVRCEVGVPLCVQMRYESGYMSLCLVQSAQT
ncbi:hypothetical protein WDU94_015488, partial [Cyamophila willieti]